MFLVDEQDQLRWYRFAHDQGWQPNNGQVIGNGWGDIQKLFGWNQDLFGVDSSGDLYWYHYNLDESGNFAGWAEQQVIGNGWDIATHICYDAVPAYTECWDYPDTVQFPV